LSSFDVIVEATDNFNSKYLLNDTAIELGKPLATAGILSWSGHAQFVVPGQSPCLRCAVPAEPQGVPTTSQFGVIGAVAGMMGCLQAAAVIRWLTGQWQPEPDESGALHSFDGDAMRLSTICVKRRAHCRCAPLWST
jgi:molybdopterin/thiamine biosynthesis adenylyltransferase